MQMRMGNGFSPLSSAKLLCWYDRHGRDLPWRQTRDPYRILQSEIMLQQTQVSRVIDYYERWLRQFPDWKALAEARSADVIRAWSGLGYNRRALVLQNIAKEVVRQGEPKDYDGWLELKGIGPYTAAAISVFSLHQPVLPIDTNIRRVLGRVSFGRPFSTPALDDRIRSTVEPTLAETKRFYDVPQALFDLANTHCLKTPSCATCPLRSVCLAAPKFLSGRVRIPRRSIKKATETIRAGKRHPDRIFRGRILAAVQASPNGISAAAVGKRIDPTYDSLLDKAWVIAMVSRMIRDGLLKKQGHRLVLP